MMGRKVDNGDYAKPLLIRLYKEDRKRLDDLLKTFDPIPIKFPREGEATLREITKVEVIKIALETLHKKRCKSLAIKK